ncbi:MULTISPECIES: hypothetical protein [Photobacterium]|nr:MULTISPECIES: hypothetical protein [Photobacterium]
MNELVNELVYEPEYELMDKKSSNKIPGIKQQSSKQTSKNRR